jgi:hypothetical protein
MFQRRHYTENENEELKQVYTSLEMKEKHLEEFDTTVQEFGFANRK